MIKEKICSTGSITARDPYWNSVCFVRSNIAVMRYFISSDSAVKWMYVTFCTFSPNYIQTELEKPQNTNTLALDVNCKKKIYFMGTNCKDQMFNVTKWLSVLHYNNQSESSTWLECEVFFLYWSIAYKEVNDGMEVEKICLLHICVCSTNIFQFSEKKSIWLHFISFHEIINIFKYVIFCFNFRLLVCFKFVFIFF